MAQPLMPPLQALFSAQGRMRRRDFWIYSVAIVFAFWVGELGFSSIWGLGTNVFQSLPKALDGRVYGYVIAVLVLGYVLEIPRFFIIAKRWHDRDRSAWLSALSSLAGAFDLLPRVACDLFYPNTPASSFLHVFALPHYVFAIWILIECGCLPGKPKINRYGPSLTGPVPEDHF